MIFKAYLKEEYAYPDYRHGNCDGHNVALPKYASPRPTHQIQLIRKFLNSQVDVQRRQYYWKGACYGLIYSAPPSGTAAQSLLNYSERSPFYRPKHFTPSSTFRQREEAKYFLPRCARNNKPVASLIDSWWASTPPVCTQHQKDLWPQVHITNGIWAREIDDMARKTRVKISQTGEEGMMNGLQSWVGVLNQIKF
jgi:hypothetical protein